MAKTFLKRALGVLIVFDLSSDVSFENCVHWIREVKRHAHKDACNVMIGNKSDLVDDIKVTDEQIQKLCDKYNMQYFKTSARTGANIKESFEYVAK